MHLNSESDLLPEMSAPRGCKHLIQLAKICLTRYMSETGLLDREHPSLRAHSQREMLMPTERDQKRKRRL